MKLSRQRIGRSRAFTLIEVVIALGIVAVGIFAIVGLLPLGLDAARNTTERTAGLAWLEEVAEDIRSIPSNASAGDLSPRFEVPLPSPGVEAIWTGYFSEGKRVPGAEDARYALDFTLSRPASGQPGALHVHGRARWPAGAGPGIEQGSVHLTTAFAE